MTRPDGPASPRSTYRLQINAGFTLADAAERIGYLHRLGVDWVYCSPLLAATPGSDHGYDVIDPGRTDPGRGGPAGLATLAAAAHGAGMGVLVDIVPNHVGVSDARASVWWWDVLRRGAASPHAVAFDIDWDAGNGRVRIPVLDDPAGADPDGELDALRLARGLLWYHAQAFPVAAGTGDGTPREVHARQHYELVNFRRADAELNYRRFFAVSTLAAIRVEVPEVFTASHAEIARWFAAGWVDGLRVDHPDGLADPAAYLRDLAGLSGGAWSVVEKILEVGEDLPDGWWCAGTTGYDTLGLIDRLLVDPAGEGPLTALDTALRGAPCDWTALAQRAKRAVADGILGSEVRRLARVLLADRSAPSDAEAAADAIAELLSWFPVYRTYPGCDDAPRHRAEALARRSRPDLAAPLDAIATAAGVPGGEFATRLAQTSGAVMAKGVEDCAFYRYPRLTSLTEVGADPSVFAVTPERFHHAQRARLAVWPDGMTTLSTHDTKRGEDVRARIDVLSEVPAEWAELVTAAVARTRFPDGVLANLLLQAAIGCWPGGRGRLHAYAEKAAREAGTSTCWADPDAVFERRMHAFVDAILEPPLREGLAAFADRIRPAGWSNSLAAKLIQLTIPGVPDVYRGTELWEDSLVDPDNRRPFDPLVPSGAADLLDRLDAGWLPPVDATGAAKLLVTSRALRARRDRSELFTGYRPLPATGPAAGHAVCFDRGGAITLATRLPLGLGASGGWGDTVVPIPPGLWTDALTGTRVRGGFTASASRARTVTAGADPVAGGVPVPVAGLLCRYPVALLLRSG